MDIIKQVANGLNTIIIIKVNNKIDKRLRL